MSRLSRPLLHSAVRSPISRPIPRGVIRHKSITPATPNSRDTTGLPPPKPDYSYLLSSPEAVPAHLEARRSPLSLPVDQFIASVRSLHDEVNTLSSRVRDVRSRRNALGKVLADKSSAESQRSEARSSGEKLREELGQVEASLAEKEQSLLELTLQLPNRTAPDVPVGGYEAVQVVKLQPEGVVEKRDERADHIALLQSLGWMATPTHVTGSSWPYLLRGGALLEQALIQYAISQALEEGYELVCPPDVVKHEIMKRCGFAPRDTGGEAQTYFVSTSSSSGDAGEEADLALAATSEIPLAGYFANALYRSPSELPKKVVGVGHAFRAEAGSRGKESRGLYRVHQFTKVELFGVTEGAEEISSAILQDMLKLQWRILEGLNLPLRLLNMPTEELGATAYQKYDIESWMPGRGSWGELASSSNCTDYQARRLDIRYKPAPPSPGDESTPAPKTAYCHTLNASAAAIPRLIVALVENGCRFDEQGNWIALELPKVLRKFWLDTEAKTDEAEVKKKGEIQKGKSKQGRPSRSSIVLRWV